MIEIIFIAPPWSIIALIVIAALCTAAMLITIATVRAPQDAFRERSKEFFFVSVFLSIFIFYSVTALFIFPGYLMGLFSEWGVVFEHKVPQAVLYHVLWGAAFLAAQLMLIPMIKRGFKDGRRYLWGRALAKRYILLSTLFVFAARATTAAVVIISDAMRM